MKKFLSLVLALVMTMSLVTVSAGAEDFTDDSSITYEEAVDVMSAVKVIDGYTDGSFQPTTLLTRGAAAKIICNLILGPTTAAALGADSAPYSDVPTTNVFAGYIAYCQKEGIISGYADGTFKPSAPLTGYAFMKMLLGALGYDSAKEGYTGANWSVNVAKQALAIGLDDGNDEFVGQASVNREEAMLYAFNTLKATMVTYGNDTTITVGDVEISTSGKASYETCTAGSGNDGNIDGTSGDGYVQFGERYFGKLTKVSGATTDTFARPANVWKYDNKEIGTYAKTPDVVYTAEVESGEIYADLGLTATDDYDVVIDGVAGVTADYASIDASGNFKLERGNDILKIGANGVQVEVYEDATTICLVNTYVGEVTIVEEETAKKDAYIVISDLSDVDPMGGNDEFETEAFAENDIVLYTFSQKDNEIVSVEKAESVTGEVTKYTSNKSFVVDGTTYSYTNTIAAGNKISNVDVDVTAYLDTYGYVIYTDDVEVTVANVAYVLNAGADSGRGGTDKWATLLYTDGTVETVTTSKIYGTAGTASPSADVDLVGHFVSHKTNANDVVTLTKATGFEANDTTTVNSSTKVVENGKAAVTLTGGDITNFGDAANTATLFLLYSEDDSAAKVYTGIKQVPTVTLTGNSKVAALAESGKAAAVIVIYTDDATMSSNSNQYLFLRGNDNAKVNVTSDATYYEFDAVMDGEITTVMLDYTDTNTAAAIDSTLTAGTNMLLVDFSVDGDLVMINASNEVDGTNGGDYATVNTDSVTKPSGDVFSVGGNALTIADDVVVYKVSASGTLSKSTLSAVRAGDVGTAAGDYYAEFAYATNDDGVVTAIYFELN